MAYSTIPKSSSYFNTKLYTGNASTNAITGVGFQPDWCWIKGRGTTNAHMLFDAVRGVGEALNSNNGNAEATVSTAFTSFDSDGFTVGNYSETNTNSENYVSWNWRASGTSGSANGDGSISSTVSVDTTSGFSIVSYTGNGTLGATVGHGLGQTPGLFVTKRLSGTSSWGMYHQSTGAGGFMELNGTAGLQSNNAYFNNTAPTSSVFTIGTDSINNTNGSTYIAYCFAEKQGYSKFGSYVGNGNADGPMIYTGFKPAFVLLKNITLSVENWIINDSGRNPSNIVDKDLFPNQNYVEAVHSRQDFLSNGFKMRSTANNSNNSGNTYIYMAFGQPIVSTNNVIATAR